METGRSCTAISAKRPKTTRQMPPRARLAIHAIDSERLVWVSPHMPRKLIARTTARRIAATAIMAIRSRFSERPIATTRGRLGMPNSVCVRDLRAATPGSIHGLRSTWTLAATRAASKTKAETTGRTTATATWRSEPKETPKTSTSMSFTNSAATMLHTAHENN